MITGVVRQPTRQLGQIRTDAVCARRRLGRARKGCISVRAAVVSPETGANMARAWVLWLVLLTTVAAYAVLVGWFGPQVQAAAGGLTPFDLRATGYGIDAARAFLTALTPEGRAIYLGPGRVNDTIFPVLFTVTLILPVRRRAWLWWLPALAYGVFDLAENWAVARLLVTGPTVEAGPVALASALTQAKFAAVLVAVVLALWGLWAGWRAR